MDENRQSGIPLKSGMKAAIGPVTPGRERTARTTLLVGGSRVLQETRFEEGRRHLNRTSEEKPTKKTEFQTGGFAVISFRR
jgi:hypothetical protein